MIFLPVNNWQLYVLKLKTITRYEKMIAISGNFNIRLGSQ
jgi:hypothetical protein